jgi:cbb3-type cytochrome oxidase subunit 3
MERMAGIEVVFLLFLVLVVLGVIVWLYFTNGSER